MVQKAKVQIICVEGNISAGKSTLVMKLGELLKCKSFLEPTMTNPYLEKFYKDPKGYGLKMQLWLLRQRYQIYSAAIKHALLHGESVLLDRSIFSDYVFADQSRIDGIIDEEGFSYYLSLRSKMMESLPLPDVTLFLDASPEECYRRVHEVRKRGCESGIPLSYLSGLDKCYRNLLSSMEKDGANVMKVEWNEFGSAEEIADMITSVPETSWGIREELLLCVSDNEVMNEKMGLTMKAPHPADDQEVTLDIDREYYAYIDSQESAIVA